MTVAGDTQEVAAGDLVMVPPATDHSIANDGERGPLLRLGPVARRSPSPRSSAARPPGRRRVRGRGRLLTAGSGGGVVAHGRVQGVFFRDSVRRRAEAPASPAGSRNRDDGAVEAVFEGEPEQVEAMVEFCRAGPGRAEVERARGDRGGARGPRPASRCAEAALAGRRFLTIRAIRAAGSRSLRRVPELSRSQLLVYGAVAVAAAAGRRALDPLRRDAAQRAGGERLSFAADSLRSRAATGARDVVVHVAGAVARPGVYRLPAGARVTDAVKRAGGLAPRRARTRSTSPPGSATASRWSCPARGAAAAPPPAAEGPISLGTATVEQLDEIEGIGPVTAAGHHRVPRRARRPLLGRRSSIRSAASARRRWRRCGRASSPERAASGQCPDLVSPPGLRHLSSSTRRAVAAGRLVGSGV